MSTVAGDKGICKERGSSASVHPAFHIVSSHYHAHDSNLLGSKTNFGMPRHFLPFRNITSLISPLFSYNKSLSGSLSVVMKPMYFRIFPHLNSPPRLTIHFISKSTLYRFLRTPEKTESVHPFELDRRHCLSDLSTSPHERIANFVPTHKEAYHKSEGEVMNTKPRDLCDGSSIYIIQY